MEILEDKMVLSDQRLNADLTAGALVPQYGTTMIDQMKDKIPFISMVPKIRLVDKIISEEVIIVLYLGSKIFPNIEIFTLCH